MLKYEPLEKHLARQNAEFLPISFREIERIIDAKLPASAREHRAWWSNNPSNSVMTKAWLAAGYKSQDVDLEGEVLVFRRVAKPAPDAPATRQGPHPLLGRLSGAVHLTEDKTLCDPIAEDWQAASE